MKKILFPVLGLMIIAFPLFPQQPGPASVLEGLFESGVDAVAYTEQFESAVSREQLQSALDGIMNQLGEFREIRGDSNPYTVVFSGGTASAVVSLAKGGELAGLRFTSIDPAVKSLDEAVAENPGGCLPQRR
mgnify:FL=1